MASQTNASNSEISIPQEQQESLLQLQRDILESVAISNDHKANLDKLCLAAEIILPNSSASIMLFNETHECLFVKAAPSLPKEAIQQLNGLVPGPHAGSCGTALYCKSPVFVEDTSTDPRWEGFSEFILSFNTHACWSVPIILSTGEMIGSFALTSYESRAPTDFQKELLSISASLAGIILHREEMEKNLWNLAHYDSLTQLPNRTLLNQRLSHSLTVAERRQLKIAVLFIDLDHFKNINDSYGHSIGDEVLINAANTINACIHEQDTLSRISGDEFVLLLENITDSIDASKMAQTILDSLTGLPPITGTNSYLSASIGISTYPEDAQTGDEILRNADTAMYQAKKEGRNCFSFYESSFTHAIQQQLELEAELKTALIENEFEVYYQPQFTCKHNKLVSAEALVRWNHPKKGFLAPGDFIPTAEKSKLISKIGLWVLNSTCLQGVTWLNKGIKFDRLSVNLSARQLVKGFHQEILNIARKANFPLNKLELEITESLLMENGHIAIEELELLHDQGISIAMDDFGTGYSSLHQIRSLPIDKLKIDRSFISDIPHNQDDITLARMIIAMGKSLSLEVIAEGIETEQQQEFLINEGCDLLQGFLLGKPMPAATLEPLMHQT